MNRRSFLKGLSVLIGGVALEEAIPLGRVWSFPSVVKPLNTQPIPVSYICGAGAYYRGVPEIIARMSSCAMADIYHLRHSIAYSTTIAVA